MIRLELPYHLRTLAGIGSEVELEVGQPATVAKALDALEQRYPMLKGTIRDHGSQRRRPYLRYFACNEDISHRSPDQPLPEPVATGNEPLIILGAVAGG